jgi:PAS domain S-box-containing protein
VIDSEFLRRTAVYHGSVSADDGRDSGVGDLVAALRRSEQNFRTIIERAPLPMCVSSAVKLVYTNPAMRAYLGYELDGELLGPTLAELSDEIIHPDDRNRVRDAFRQLFFGLEAPQTPGAEQVVRINDVRLRRKSDGGLLFCDMHGVIVLHDGSSALVTYLHDQTESRAAADRVRSAERMASLGALAAGVAHEINNPLTYVMSSVDLVAGQLTASRHDRAMAQALSDANAGLDRIRNIVRALKTLSRRDDEKIGPVDVVHSLESCVAMAGSHLRHRGRLVRKYADVPPVRGNETRLGQVFLNLLVNAAESLEEADRDHNEVVVQVSASNDVVTVEVRDTGAGIAPADLPHIFDPFFTTKPVGVGTGLGLFVCHGITTALGGEISVDSVVGHGTTVRVRLPVASNEPTLAPHVSPLGGTHLRARILVIDDEPKLLETVRTVLKEEHDVTTLSTAREALDRLLAGDRYDLILCDLMMPVMSGVDLFARLATERPDLTRKLVFMTGGAVTAAAAALLENKATRCLEKPFRTGELLAFVRSQVRP